MMVYGSIEKDINVVVSPEKISTETKELNIKVKNTVKERSL